MEVDVSLPKQNFLLLHPRNLHHGPYDFYSLIRCHSQLSAFVFQNEYKNRTIDFSNPLAVRELNKALLKLYYKVKDWNIPQGNLCPPVPGRADYIHHLADLLEPLPSNYSVKGLDIGVGANCIYPILAAAIYNWEMVGTDSNVNAIKAAVANVQATPGFEKFIKIRHQENNSFILKGVIKETDFFNFSMCNPPFYNSEQVALKENFQKFTNLEVESPTLNFGGQANELWCNGGESLFIKRLIKESFLFKEQVGWFTSLVSKKENLLKLYKQLEKLKAFHKTIEMQQGNKKTRFIAWKWVA